MYNYSIEQLKQDSIAVATIASRGKTENVQKADKANKANKADNSVQIIVHSASDSDSVSDKKTKKSGQKSEDLSKYFPLDEYYNADVMRQLSRFRRNVEDLSNEQLNAQLKTEFSQTYLYGELSNEEKNVAIFAEEDSLKKDEFIKKAELRFFELSRQRGKIYQDFFQRKIPLEDSNTRSLNFFTSLREALNLLLDFYGVSEQFKVSNNESILTYLKQFEKDFQKKSLDKVFLLHHLALYHLDVIKKQNKAFQALIENISLKMKVFLHIDFTTFIKDYKKLSIFSDSYAQNPKAGSDRVKVVAILDELAPYVQSNDEKKDNLNNEESEPNKSLESFSSQIRVICLESNIFGTASVGSGESLKPDQSGAMDSGASSSVPDSSSVSKEDMALFRIEHEVIRPRLKEIQDIDAHELNQGEYKKNLEKMIGDFQEHSLEQNKFEQLQLATVAQDVVGCFRKLYNNPEGIGAFVIQRDIKLFLKKGFKGAYDNKVKNLVRYIVDSKVDSVNKQLAITSDHVVKIKDYFIQEVQEAQGAKLGLFEEDFDTLKLSFDELAKNFHGGSSSEKTTKSDNSNNSDNSVSKPADEEKQDISVLKPAGKIDPAQCSKDFLLFFGQLKALESKIALKILDELYDSQTKKIKTLSKEQLKNIKKTPVYDLFPLLNAVQEIIRLMFKTIEKKHPHILKFMEGYQTSSEQYRAATDYLFDFISNQDSVIPMFRSGIERVTQQKILLQTNNAVAAGCKNPVSFFSSNHEVLVEQAGRIVQAKASLMKEDQRAGNSQTVNNTQLIVEANDKNQSPAPSKSDSSKVSSPDKYFKHGISSRMNKLLTQSHERLREVQNKKPAGHSEGVQSEKVGEKRKSSDINFLSILEQCEKMQKLWSRKIMEIINHFCLCDSTKTEARDAYTHAQTEQFVLKK